MYHEVWSSLFNIRDLKRNANIQYTTDIIKSSQDMMIKMVLIVIKCIILRIIDARYSNIYVGKCSSNVCAKQKQKMNRF